MVLQKLVKKAVKGMSWPLGVWLLCIGQTSHALEVVAGDYEVLPEGVTVGLQYYQYAKRSKLYADGDKVASDFDFTSSVGLTRLIKPFKINESTYFDLNVILPYGKLQGKNGAEPLGSSRGIGDLILGGATKFLLDPDTRDVFSVGTYIHLPTGNYDNTKVLNFGENRWKAVIQLAYIKHFNERWALDLVADTQLHGDNDDFGSQSVTLKQKPRYELQGHLRYNTSKQTALTLGVGNIRGAQQTIDNQAQDDALNTTYLRVGANHWLSLRSQLQFQLGRDLFVKQGPKEDLRVNLRFGYVF